MRTCVVCRSKAPASSLYRIRFDEGWVVDGPARGRSAYCCREGECPAGVIQKGRLSRALKFHVDDVRLQTLKAALAAGAR